MAEKPDDWKARYMSNALPLLVGDAMYARGTTDDYGAKVITKLIVRVTDDYGKVIGWVA